MEKTSVVHQDIGEHECEMTIYQFYETYAACSKCGRHDWSHPKDWDGNDSLISYFKGKYPNATIVGTEALMKDPDNKHCGSETCYGRDGDLCDCECAGCKETKELGI
jgi:hypothetical protein